MVNLCPDHKKELRVGKGGRMFCPTPITKSADGSKVLEWCQYNPANAPAETQPVPLPESTREKANGDSKDSLNFKSEEKLSMMRMSALKAASEVVSAYLTRPDVTVSKNITELLLQVSDRCLLWLKISFPLVRRKPSATEESKGEEDLI